MPKRITDEFDADLIESILDACDYAYSQTEEGTVIDVETDKGTLRIQIFLTQENEIDLPDDAVMQ